MGNKEKLYELIKENEAGITYTDLEKKFKERYGKQIKSGYVYLSELTKEGKIEPVRTAKVEGRKVVYRIKEISKKSPDIASLEYLKKQLDTKKVQLRQLYSLMSKKMDFTKKPDNNDVEFIKVIKETI